MTDLSELLPLLSIQLDNIVQESKMLDLLKSAVVRYNAVVSGSLVADDTLLDRDIEDEDKQLLVLFSVLNWLDGVVIRESFNAITISNPAGRTKLDGVEFALAKRRKELLDSQVNELINKIKSRAVVGETSAHELGETRELAPDGTNPMPIWPGV